MALWARFGGLRQAMILRTFGLQVHLERYGDPEYELEHILKIRDTGALWVMSLK